MGISQTFKTNSSSNKANQVKTNVQAELQKIADDMHGVFTNLFDVVHADTDELRQQAWRLRYQVFCIENQGYEDPDLHPSCMETDNYDKNAEFVLVKYKPLDMTLGTIRVIKPDPDDLHHSFPLQELGCFPYTEPKDIRNACELSRFSISRAYRELVKQHATEHYQDFFTDSARDLSDEHKRALLKKGLALASVGLVRGALDVTLKNNITNIFCVMEPYKVARLKQIGINLKQIGQEFEFHGARVPLHCDIVETCESAEHNLPVWSILTDKGQLYRDAFILKERIKKGELHCDDDLLDSSLDM